MSEGSDSMSSSSSNFDCLIINFQMKIIKTIDGQITKILNQVN